MGLSFFFLHGPTTDMARESCACGRDEGCVRNIPRNLASLGSPCSAGIAFCVGAKNTIGG